MIPIILIIIFVIVVAYFLTAKKENKVATPPEEESYTPPAPKFLVYHWDSKVVKAFENAGIPVDLAPVMTDESILEIKGIGPKLLESIHKTIEEANNQ